MQLAQRKAEVSREFYANSPTIPGFPSPEVASAWLRPALIATAARLISRAPRRGLGPSIGSLLYLVSIALLAAATIGVFFGIAFCLSRQPANAVVSEWPVRGHGSDVRTPSQGSLSGVAVPALASPKTATAMAKPAQPLRPNSAPATPDPAPKAAQGAPAEAGAKTPTARHLPDREIAELLARGDGFLLAGDIASAQLFYERAADSGDRQAALRMGATFDPAFLASAGLRNLPGDRAKARLWYHRALGLGASEAQPHLNSFETK